MPEAVAENIIAHGSYTYWRSGEPAGVSETWASYGGPEGVQFTRSARHAPSFGSTITVEAWANSSTITRFTVEWENATPEAVPHASAAYTLTAAEITVERTLSGVAQTSIQLPTPAHLVISPLLRCFQGAAIKQVAELGRGERVPVLVPWIHDPRNAELLLTPQLDLRSAKKLSSENDLDCYEYVGGNYDDAARFWLKANGQMVKYTFGEWLVEIGY